MQTFLPFPNFLESAKLLDKKRCFKQVVESKQILDIIQNKTQGWKNHPIVRMWRNYEDALTKYHNIFFIYSRDYHKINFQKLTLLDEKIEYNLPGWMGNEKFHYSHRCNLLRKAIETKNKELENNLLRNNITVDNHDIKTQYLWL